MAKLVDALDLGSSEQPSWEFESLRPQYILCDTENFQINSQTMINWNIIAQLISLGLVVLSGPAVIFLLYFKRGNL